MGLPGASAAPPTPPMPRLSVCRLRALFGPRQGPSASVPFLLPGKEAGSAVSGMEGRQTKRRANIIISGGSSRVIPTTNCPQATPSAPAPGRVAKGSLSRHGIGGDAGPQFPRDVCLSQTLCLKLWQKLKEFQESRVLPRSRDSRNLFFPTSE